MHFLWDWAALSQAGEISWPQTLTGMLLMLGGCLFYGVLVIVGSDWSRKIFAPHGKLSLWGWPFALRNAAHDELKLVSGAYFPLGWHAE